MKRMGLLVLIVFLALTGCERKQPPPKPKVQAKPAAPAGPVLSEATHDRLKALQKLGSGWFTDLSNCAAGLQDDTHSLLGQPDDAHLDAARKRLQQCLILDQASRLAVGMTRAQEKALTKIRNNLDQPLDMPGFVDSIKGYPHSGIVNDSSLKLTADNLRKQQGLIDEQDVAIGFDVVAFLLWGEHHFNPKLPPRTPDQLTAVEQWDSGHNGIPVSEHPQNRRRQYLQLAATLLQQDCDKLKTTWDKDTLPTTETDAKHWQTTALKQAQKLLEQFPDNTVLATDLDQWLKVLESGAAPASAADATPAKTPDAAALVKRVQAALTALTTGTGKSGTATP